MRDRCTEAIRANFLPRTLRESAPENRPSRWRRSAFGWRSLLFLGLILSLSFNVFSQNQPSEYQVKAAFLYNFAKFVEWPPASFPKPNSPIVIGVLGKNVFGNALEQVIRNHRVNDHPFQFKTFNSAADAAGHCQILFISSSQKDNFSRIIEELHGASVLTVSENDGFIKAGGMINFVIEDNKIRFQISDAAAKKAGLKISSKLLTLAVNTR
ncbi:MAG TPA: YfiR family protein [Candidatus Angelobacter sp.]|nr:YfiR family protein [Candidatus Angelobacter sp.]